MKGDPTPLESFFPYRLAVGAERFSQALAEVYGANFGLSREEWRLLFLLAGETQVTSLDLARRTTLDKVQVSRASQRLVDKGLITRCVASEDRRLRLYACTEKGRALFASALPDVQDRAARILNAMSPEDKQALNQGLSALIRALERTAADSA
ncbi:MarR family winged helix-turn-helix transcriptional regulator [Primorskyibacter sp. 2E233]|uniref:MarR family winged helix-turn-helix transcriptional regulator n=1 Tax=Primorskyibacter sp. 2E233 TaxID=3413431 RepID=UPI003BF16259